MYYIVFGLLLSLTICQNLSAFVEGNAECEILDFGVVHCMNIRSRNEDYSYSIEVLLPEYLDHVALTKGPDIGLLISDSDLDDFPEDLLEGFNITHLALMDNDFSVFPTSFIRKIASNVVYLELDGNNIKDFLWKNHTDSLPFAGALLTIILRACNLASFGEGAFSGFTNLQNLDLSDNFINEVPPRAFANYYTLQDIDLSRNLLVTLGKGSFSGLPSLRKLDLSLNFILFLEAGTFVDLENLNQLNLLNNEILQVEETTFNERDVPKLIDLRIAENPLICDCNLQWLKVWLIEHSGLEESGATCLFPEVAMFGEVDFCPTYTLQFNLTQL